MIDSAPAAWLEIGGALASFALLLGYEACLLLRLRRNPRYALVAVNAQIREAWVEHIMKKGDGILAVQTLRNSTMTATFLASTAAILVIGALNLAGTSGSLAQFWHALNIFPEAHAGLWMTKLLVLVLILLVAFFCFTISIRLFHHVGYYIQVPADDPRASTPKGVARLLNQAGGYLAFGLRAYYFAGATIFWLFGPQFMLVATLVLIAALLRIDRPRP